MAKRTLTTDGERSLKFLKSLHFILTFCLLSFLCQPKLSAQDRRGENKESRPQNVSASFSVDWTREVRFRFQDIPLFDALTFQAESNRFSFFLDRRVDPEIPVTYSADAVPLAAALTEMIEGVGLETVRLGPILYVGPPESGGELLLTLFLHRQAARGNPNQAKEGLEKRVAFPKDDFVEPAALLKDAAKKGGLSWSGLDKMPFDYWRNGTFPPLAAGDLFSLVLIGFGVDYRLDDRKPVLKPVAFQKEGTVIRSWPAEEISGIRRGDFPDVEWMEIRNEIRGTGPFREIARIEYRASKERMKNVLREVHDRREREDAGGRSDSSVSGSLKRNSGGGNLLSGEIRQATLQFVFDELKNQLDLDCVLDSSVDKMGMTLETRISCRFDNANPKRALKIIADELGVSYRLNGRRAVFYKK